MIDKTQFLTGFTVLCERFNKTFSDPTIAAYYQALNPHLTDESWLAAWNACFASDEFFPSPQRLIELARQSQPVPVWSLPPSTPKAFADMSPEEQQEYRASLAAARRQLDEAPKPERKRRSGFAHISEALQEIKTGA